MALNEGLSMRDPRRDTQNSQKKSKLSSFLKSLCCGEADKPEEAIEMTDQQQQDRQKRLQQQQEIKRKNDIDWLSTFHREITEKLTELDNQSCYTIPYIDKLGQFTAGVLGLIKKEPSFFGISQPELDSLVNQQKDTSKRFGYTVGMSPLYSHKGIDHSTAANNFKYILNRAIQLANSGLRERGYVQAPDPGAAQTGQVVYRDTTTSDTIGVASPPYGQ